MLNNKGETVSKWSPSSSFKDLFHRTKKGANAQRKLQKTIRAYAEERAKQREHLNKETAGVDKLLEEGSISEDIHARYKKMLEKGYSQKRRETREKYGFTNPESP